MSVLTLLASTVGRLTTPASGDTARAAEGIHKIKHIVIIMQENRSFDSYFGTYPGADGIPMKNEVPTCPARRPYRHDRAWSHSVGVRGSRGAAVVSEE